ncbi:hypothetical protein JY420_03420 [Stenotrophomonas maltophilia]|nr:hypothetical protein [Stenotrophomonas maltophilia]MBN5133228.1 hypothetical protein [Stenotrophomonas maltophilia]
MSNDKTTLADVQPGGRVRLGDQAERARFEDWYVQNAFDYTTNPIGSRECALMWNAWDAALSAQPSPGGQGEALATALEVFERRRADIPYEVYEQVKVVCAALAARQPVGDQHPDDLAVDAFAAAMKAKMAEARAKGRGGWEDPAQCTDEDLSRMLREHVEKGDARDVANFCMMLHQRGEAIAARQPVGEPVGRVRTRVDGEFIAELLPGVADRVSNMAPLYLQQPAQAVDLGPLWVSVNDRLPSEEDYGESGDVVVRYRYNAPNSVQGSWDVGESRHDADDSEWNNGWLFGSCDYAEVSHWMPKHALLSLLDRLAVGQ